MPFTTKSAPKHTKKFATPSPKKSTANAVIKRTGDDVKATKAVKEKPSMMSKAKPSYHGPSELPDKIVKPKRKSKFQG